MVVRLDLVCHKIQSVQLKERWGQWLFHHWQCISQQKCMMNNSVSHQCIQLRRIHLCNGSLEFATLITALETGMMMRRMSATPLSTKCADSAGEDPKPQKSQRSRLSRLAPKAALVKGANLDALQAAQPSNRPDRPDAARPVANGPRRVGRMLNESASTHLGTQVDHLHDEQHQMRANFDLLPMSF